MFFQSSVFAQANPSQNQQNSQHDHNCADGHGLFIMSGILQLLLNVEHNFDLVEAFDVLVEFLVIGHNRVFLIALTRHLHFYLLLDRDGGINKNLPFKGHQPIFK